MVDADIWILQPILLVVFPDEWTRQLLFVADFKAPLMEAFSVIKSCSFYSPIAAWSSLILKWILWSILLVEFPCKRTPPRQFVTDFKASVIGAIAVYKKRSFYSPIATRNTRIWIQFSASLLNTFPITDTNGKDIVTCCSSVATDKWVNVRPNSQWLTCAHEIFEKRVLPAFLGLFATTPFCSEN